ncbi:MAG TPA: hypothetical protein VJ822_19000, partial [Dongiaceae bacterium]|nr:hypothetical protein [Dongiaceae bacterium]
MSVQPSLSAAAAILAVGLSSHALAQEAAAPAAAPETPALPPETVAAAPALAPISADIIKPEFVESLRRQLQQPVTILSVVSSNKRHEDVQQAEIDKLDEAWKTEAKSNDQPLIAEILSSPLSSYLLYTQAKSAGL